MNTNPQSARGLTCVSWHDDRTAALRKAIADGLTAAQAAKRLTQQFNCTITRNACIGRAHRLGLSFRGRRIISKENV